MEYTLFQDFAHKIPRLAPPTGHRGPAQSGRTPEFLLRVLSPYMISHHFEHMFPSLIFCFLQLGIFYRPSMYFAARADIGAPVGTPGKGPDDPAMSMCEYFRGWSESIPCCWIKNWKIHKIKQNYWDFDVLPVKSWFLLLKLKLCY